MNTSQWMATCLACCLAALAAAPAGAEPKYTYAGLGYGYQDIDGLGSGGAFGVDASMAGADTLHLRASAGFSETASLDTNALAAGIGCNATVDDGVDLVACAGYARAEVAFTSTSYTYTADGYRVMATPKLELNGGIAFTSLDGENETAFGGGLAYSFSDSLALTADASLSSDVKAAGIGIRLYLP